MNKFNSIKLSDFPAIINLEVFRGECPCNCEHCPLGRIKPNKRYVHFGKKEISLKLLNKICLEISSYPDSCLRIHSVGEPLLWPKLYEAGKITKQRNIKTWLFTNCVTMDKNLINFISGNFNIIEVSINSISEEDYFQTKGTNSFNIVKKNIARIFKNIVCGRLGTRLLVSRVQSLNKNLDKAFVEYWKSSGIVHDAFVRTYHSYNQLLEKKASFSDTKDSPCRVHWTRFNISSDGFAVVCFNELFRKKLDKNVIIGDINTENIYSIWHGKKMDSIRKVERNVINPQSTLPCRDCNYYQPLLGDNQTSEFQLGKIETC